MADERLFTFATLTPKPGKEKELEELVRGMCPPSRAEEGCVFYQLLVPKNEGNTYHFFECWKSWEAFEAHIATPHLQNFRSKLDELVEGGRPVSYRLKALDVTF